MRMFKNLDYFRKIAPEHTKPTVIGGIISVMSLSVISIKTTLSLNNHYIIYRLLFYYLLTK